MQDYASIDDLAADYEFFGEPGSLMDMRILKGHGIAALGGAGGALLTQAVFGMESVSTFFADKPGYMALAQFVLGIAGARAIYHFEGAEGGHPAAYGFAGQVAGSAAAGGAMMLYNQYGPQPTAAPDASTPVQGMGYTGVRQVAPYYDRYKVSVPRGTRQAVNGLGSGRRGLSGEEVTGANYFQTNGINGLGEGEEAAAEAQANEEGQPGWPEDEATADVGTWIS